jgi:hypothetical protein
MTVKKNPSALKHGDLGGRSAGLSYAFICRRLFLLPGKYIEGVKEKFHTHLYTRPRQVVSFMR